MRVGGEEALFTGVDNPVENYMVVINKEVLAPARGEAEADPDKGKADHHVPGADIWNRVLGLRDVEGDDPNQAN
ncbi:MAG: hypothetical protein RL057_311 [Actinomycetota bacterium]